MIINFAMKILSKDTNSNFVLKLNKRELFIRQAVIYFFYFEDTIWRTCIRKFKSCVGCLEGLGVFSFLV